MADRNRTGGLAWDDLRFFLAVGEAGSLSGAARRLQVNHATVARRVAGLETALGRSLFDRRTDGYALTDLGRAILEAAKTMDNAALTIQQHADHSLELDGRVRLTAPRVLTDGFLIERLAGFAELHPRLDLDLISESRNLSLARREADIALRLGAPQDGDLLLRRAGRIAYDFYASPAWRERLATGEPPIFVGFDEAHDFVPEAVLVARHFGEERVKFRTDSQISQAAAARAGFGIALLPCYLAAEDNRLVRIDMGLPRHDRDVFLITRRDLAKVPRVRAVLDYLVDLFRRDSAHLERRWLERDAE